MVPFVASLAQCSTPTVRAGPAGPTGRRGPRSEIESPLRTPTRVRGTEGLPSTTFPCSSATSWITSGESGTWNRHPMGMLFYHKMSFTHGPGGLVLLPCGCITVCVSIYQLMATWAVNTRSGECDYGHPRPGFEWPWLTFRLSTCLPVESCVHPWSMADDLDSS